jgi:hypothetical protein
MVLIGEYVRISKKISAVNLKGLLAYLSEENKISSNCFIRDIRWVRRDSNLLHSKVNIRNCC